MCGQALIDLFANGGVFSCTLPCQASTCCPHPSQVHLLVRGDRLRASKAMADRTTSCKGVTVQYNMAVEDAYGDNLLSGLHLYNTKTGGRGGSTITHSLKPAAPLSLSKLPPLLSPSGTTGEHSSIRPPLHHSSVPSHPPSICSPLF